MREEMFFKILEKEMVPALGCTDPVGVAYGAAYARSFTKGEVKSIRGELSVNIIKNVAAVCIPKTDGRCGVPLALALGALGGDSKAGLEVLSDITEKHIEEALMLIEEGKVKASVADNDKKLYIKATVETESEVAEVVIEDSYTNVTCVTVNGKVVYRGKETTGTQKQEEGEIDYSELSLANILEFAESVDVDRLEIIKRAVDMNLAAAEAGLSGEYGVAVGKNLKSFMESGKMGTDISSNAMMWTTAAIDARMAGYDIAVMSNTGSGNQGLASTIPVISVAKKMQVGEEKMLRAVLISSLVTIYIKEQLGVLSAVCGAVIAGTGTACGVVYLLDGNAANMELALQSTLGDVSGMLCDGAKAGCSMKVATCTSTGILAAMFAMNGNGIHGTDGIVGNGEKKTIENFIKISTDGMNKMDNVILNIILDK